MTENYNELARMHHDSDARASSLKLDINHLKRDMSTMADDMKIMKDFILSQSMKCHCTDNGEDESTQQEMNPTQLIHTTCSTSGSLIMNFNGLETYIYHWINNNAEQTYSS